MAQLEVDGTDLVLRLSTGEKVEGMHGDLHAPLTSVTGVEVLDDAHRAADIVGIRAGTRIPRVIEVASVHGVNKTIYAAVHHDTPRGVRVSLAGQSYDEWIVGCADPEAVAASILRPS